MKLQIVTSISKILIQFKTKGNHALSSCAFNSPFISTNTNNECTFMRLRVLAEIQF